MYIVVVKKSAAKEIAELPSKISNHVLDAIKNLAENPRPLGCKKLKGEHTELWRIRVGDYRVIYFIGETIKIVEIRRVGHRKDIYE